MPSRLRATLKSLAYSGLARDRWQRPEAVLEVLQIRPGQRVADLGAGDGYFAYRLSRLVGSDGRVYAIDPDADMRAHVEAGAARRGLSNLITVAADPDRPSLPEPVDLVLLVNAFHHVPDQPRYFAALAEQLHAGARVAVVEALPRWYLFGHATEPEQVRTTMTGAGFALVAEHGFLPRQGFLVFARP